MQNFLKSFVDMGFSLPRTQPLQRQIITIPRLVKPRRLQPSKSHTFNSHICKLDLCNCIRKYFHLKTLMAENRYYHDYLIILTLIS